MTETLIVAVGVLIIACWVGAKVNNGMQTHRRLRLIERQLNLLMKHAGTTEAPPLSPEVQALARSRGGKIAAIKLHRQQTGLDLADAKADVDDFLKG